MSDRAFEGMKAHPASRRADVPRHLRSWLFDPRSLTRRLARHCPGGPQVRLLVQHWCVPAREERVLLGLPPRELALVREVVLACDGTPWVFGRSVFPRRSITRHRWRIGHLGNRSLGDVLFSTPGMRRVSARVTPAEPGNRLHSSAARAVHGVRLPAWQRDSLFGWRGQTLLVSELFLEPLCRAARASCAGHGNAGGCEPADAHSGTRLETRTRHERADDRG